jgi:lysyl-tRNA synthetase class 1
VDWPAKWFALGVTCEPFGKDHATRGGSYDTGCRIAREVFGIEPPYPTIYEWISLTGQGDMSSSKGNVVSVSEMLEVVPPEVLRYLVLRIRPNKAIRFDPGVGLLRLIDEFDEIAGSEAHPRASALALSARRPDPGVPFRHMVNVVQIAGEAGDAAVLAILERTGIRIADRAQVVARAEYARRWVERFAPEEARFQVAEILPDGARALSEAQKKALRHIAEQISAGQDGEAVAVLIYEARDLFGLSSEEIFRAIYQAVLGRDKGPRAGWFLALLGPEFVKARLAAV